MVLLRSFGQSFTRWSGLQLPNDFYFSTDTAWQHWQTYNIPNWPIHSPNSTWGFWVLSIWRLGLFCLLCLHVWAFYNSITFHCSWSGGKDMTALQLLGGKQVPWCLRMSYIWSPSGVTLGVGDLWLLPISLIYGVLGTGQSIQWDIQHPPYGPTFINIWDSGPCRSDPTSSPPCAAVGCLPDTLTGLSGPAATSTLQSWPCFLLILAWGIRAPYSLHWTSLPSHNAQPVSGGCHLG